MNEKKFVNLYNNATEKARRTAERILMFDSLSLHDKAILIQELESQGINADYLKKKYNNQVNKINQNAHIFDQGTGEQRTAIMEHIEKTDND